ncbi:MAG: nuclear transport factor 2 family protein [Saprospiraceae bacterium]|nr:nuclear transport factor 2 family protein [Saprospiraceae bacterium]
MLWMWTSCKMDAPANLSEDEHKISGMLDQWHDAAAKADFNAYFGFLAEESVFIGTDATENWNKKEFMEFAKPYFDRGKAWSFKALERNIYISSSCGLAWFDELLDTQMKICRGSGVVEKTGEEWKIRHYVLSMTIPNELVDSVVSVKATIEDSLMLKIKQDPN